MICPESGLLCRNQECREDTGCLDQQWVHSTQEAKQRLDAAQEKKE